MSNRNVGFAVIYRWKVDPEQEGLFMSAWEALTHAIRDGRGGMGSRLHRNDEGHFVAYAQWPDRETWEKSQAKESTDPEASEAMQGTILETFPPVLLEPVRDLL